MTIRFPKFKVHFVSTIIMLFVWLATQNPYVAAVALLLLFVTIYHAVFEPDSLSKS